MAALAALARRRSPYRDSSIWDEVATIDWSRDAAKLRRWILSGLKALANRRDVALVGIDLGDCPEIFNMRGWKAADGARFSKRVGAFLDTESVAWGDESDLCYERTDSLPGRIWKAFPLCDQSPRIDIESGYLLWFGFAAFVLAETLRSGDVDYERIIGERAQIPLFLGFEELFLAVGALCRDGWTGAKRR